MYAIRSYYGETLMPWGLSTISGFTSRSSKMRAPDAIAILAQDAPRAIYELENLGVPFNRTPEGKIAQRAFGGHTRNHGEAPVKRACFV